MRLVDIHVDGDRPLELRLARGCTVVAGDDPALDRLADVLAHAFVLAGTELVGTVDAGEYLTPLDPTAVVALDLPGEGLAVLGPDDLPAVDRSRSEERRAAVEAARTARATEVEQVAAELAAATARWELAGTAVEVGTAELDQARARCGELTRAVADATARPDVLAVELAAVQAEVDALRARRDAVVDWRSRVDGAWGDDGPLAGRRSGAAGDHLAVLSRLADEGVSLGALDGPVAEAVRAWVDEVAAGTAPVDPVAEELATAVAEVDAAWMEASSQGVEGDPEVLAALAELAERRAVLADLERLAGDGLLGDHARDEVEVAHRSVVEASSRRPADREAAQRGEDEVLARYGFDSYLDFTIALSTRSAREIGEERLETVRAASLDAEADVERARRRAAARREALSASREEHLRAVASFLGERPEGPVAAALRSVPAVPDPVASVPGAADAARDAAVADLVRAVSTAEDLEAEAEDCVPRREELESLLVAASEREAAVADLVDRAVAAAEAAAVRRSAAEEAHRQAVDALAAADERCRSAELAADGLSADELLTLADDLHDLVVGRSGPGLPVVLRETLAPLGADGAAVVLGHLADRSDRTADSPQLVYLTGDRALLVWAEDAPSVSTVELRRPGWLRRTLARRAHHAV